MKLTFKNWRIEEETGYKPLTTCYMDLSIAEPFGIKAINSTANKLFKAFKHNYKYLTELTMALNWKIFEHCETKRTLAEIYDLMWKKTRDYCLDHFKGEALEYFIRTTD